MEICQIVPPFLAERGMLTELEQIKTDLTNQIQYKLLVLALP